MLQGTIRIDLREGSTIGDLRAMLALADKLDCPDETALKFIIVRHSGKLRVAAVEIEAGGPLVKNDGLGVEGSGAVDPKKV